MYQKILHAQMNFFKNSLAEITNYNMIMKR